MENLKDRTTAELLAEWERLNGIVKHHASGIYRVYAKNCLPYRPSDYERDEAIDGMTTIADELNRRCSEAGIQLYVDGMVSFSKFGDKTDDMVCPRIYATELRDLLTWLIQKGGNG